MLIAALAAPGHLALADLCDRNSCHLGRRYAEKPNKTGHISACCASLGLPSGVADVVLVLKAISEAIVPAPTLARRRIRLYSKSGAEWTDRLRTPGSPWVPLLRHLGPFLLANVSRVRAGVCAESFG